MSRKNSLFSVGITATVGLAERIPGITQAALTAILVAIKKREFAAAEKSGLGD